MNTAKAYEGEDQGKDVALMTSLSLVAPDHGGSEGGIFIGMKMLDVQAQNCV